MDAKYIALMPALWENYSDNGTSSLLSCLTAVPSLTIFDLLRGKLSGTDSEYLVIWASLSGAAENFKISGSTDQEDP